MIGRSDCAKGFADQTQTRILMQHDVRRIKLIDICSYMSIFDKRDERRHFANADNER